MNFKKKYFKFFLCVIFLVSASLGMSNNVLGTYEQVTILKPKAVKISINDVEIVKDTKSSKKIWVKNFLSDDIYAVRHSKNEDSELYVIPEQKTKEYSVSFGCIAYSEERVVISIGNKNDCRGLNTEDYSNMEVGSNGVKVGDVKISSSGISVPGVKVDKNKVKISSDILSGIQYIGEKK